MRDALFAAGAGGSATTSAAPGTRRGRARSSAARDRSGVGERARGARTGAAARDGLSRGARGRGGRGSALGASVRGARVRPLSAPVKARLFTDGGSRGNPGPAAYGYVLESEDGHVLAAHGEAIGVATNNVAEYRGLVAGLRARDRGGRRRARGRLRLGAPRQADARRVQGQERGAARARRRGATTSPTGSTR